MRARFILPVLALFAALMSAATPSAAQDEGLGTSFITPFPSGDVYALEVIGDDLADGLLGGVTEALRGDSRLTIRNKTYGMNGLMRPDFVEKLQALDEELKQQPIHIAIVMLGAWDRVSVRDAAGKRLQVGSEPWKQEYAARGDRLMKLLKKRNVAVYWVGLPIVRRYDANEDVQMMNDIMRERTYLNGMKYIDAYAGFTDESGGYSAYGPDVTGKIRLLREGDGVYFTFDGNRKLAHFVERDLRRDLTQAKADRAIPLAGTEAEQARINPDRERTASQTPASGDQPAKPGQPWAASLDGNSAAASTGGPGEQKADNGRINLRLVSPGGREETVALDIVRPAIPASVVALVTRRESADKLSQMGDAVVDQIPGGLTVMSTVALASGPGANGGKRRLTATQAPYFRVLYKGERLPPKPGRADDTAWPRPAPPDETAFVPDADPVETGATVPEPVPAKKKANAKRRE
jgi:uncharacterized protein